MYTFLIVFYVLVSAALIGLVLIQQGKGADAGAAFGSGASGTVFGARGSANFLTRATAALATLFFILSLALAYVVTGRQSGPHSVVDEAPAPAAKVEVPAVPATPGQTQPAPAAAAPATPAVPATPDTNPQQPATPKVPN
jgi:preprotein translocase subunit SecG